WGQLHRLTLERQRLGRMSARAHIGNVRAACEVAIGKAHPRAAEAVVICLLDMEARLERHALERRANCLASNPERPGRQRYCACRSRAAELDGADDRAVTIERPAPREPSKQLNAKS